MACDAHRKDDVIKLFLKLFEEPTCCLLHCEAGVENATKDFCSTTIVARQGSGLKNYKIWNNRSEMFFFFSNYFKMSDKLAVKN